MDKSYLDKAYELLPKKFPVGYQCSHCGYWEKKEREVLCWKCGLGEMIYQSENVSFNDGIDQCAKVLAEKLPKKEKCLSLTGTTEGTIKFINILMLCKPEHFEDFIANHSWKDRNSVKRLKSLEDIYGHKNAVVLGYRDYWYTTDFLKDSVKKYQFIEYCQNHNITIHAVI